MFLLLVLLIFIFFHRLFFQIDMPIGIICLAVFSLLSSRALSTKLNLINEFSLYQNFPVIPKPRKQPHRPLPVLWRKSRRLMLSGAIYLLMAPSLVFGQHLTIISDSSPPLGYVKDGEIVGVTVDLIKLLLERTGIEGKFVMYPWSRAYRIAQEEKDILIYQLTYTEERARLFQLIGPIVSSTDCLWKLKSRKDIVVKNLEDAKRYRIGVVKDYFVYTYLIQNGFEDGRNLEPIHDDDLNFKKLVSGESI